MYALVPLSLIGTATLFVLGFVGSHMIVEYLVGREYLPAAVTAGREAPAKSGAKLEERLVLDETQSAATIIAEVKGTTSIITASTPKLAETTEPAQAEPASLVSEASSQPDSKVSEQLPSEAASPPAPQVATVEVPAAAEAEPAETKPVVRSIMESVFGLYSTSKLEETPAEPAKPAEPPALNVEAADAPAATEAAQPAEVPAQNETQQAALTVTQPNDDQPSRTAATANETGRAEAIRTFVEGQRLMAAGDIRAARGLFARSLASGMPEAALALGRSYDPTYLARIKNANAAPDAVSARNWYAEWNRQSVEQGSISSDARFDRFLKSIKAN